MARAKKTGSWPIQWETTWCLKHLCNHMYLVRQGDRDEMKKHLIERAKEAEEVLAELDLKLARLEAGFEPTMNWPLADTIGLPKSRVLEVEERVDSFITAVYLSRAPNKAFLATLLNPFRQKEAKKPSQGARLAALKRRLVKLEALYDERRREKWPGSGTNAPRARL